MGSTSHLQPRSAFAAVMNGYTWHVAAAQGWDRSGRKMEEALQAADAPKRTYWLKILNGKQAMTTQDVAVLAKHFGVSPYEYIDLARDWDEAGQPVEGYLPGVGRRSDYGRAARKREDEPTDET